jgi:hypothetical protein
MNLANSLQFMHQAPKTISDGVFAFGVLNDYRADWALANDIQLETDSNAIQRNPG